MKQIKDPIYGYIEIERSIMRDIVDSPYFQRLRNIRQTSYTPLYPSSYHNRYVHSLGVYFLGKMAFKSVASQLESIKENKKLKIELPRLQEIFQIACLLHDIGHAPFSHTGEFLYKFPNADTQMYDPLMELVDEEEFANDLKKELLVNEPAPHETMSCIVSLKQFSQYFKDGKERSFFSRCIIGLPYQSIDKDEFKIYNCIIGLLNSSIIDVDRLDYIIRDADTMGFKSVSIDYERLLQALWISEETPQIGYHKNALSVIENAIYAHDVEKKWVQNHPAIHYEMYLLKYAMEYLNHYFDRDVDPNPIFCYESLTERGKELICNDEKTHLSLLADEDILHLIKRLCNNNDFIWELFCRNRRRKPLWKSEAEYIALFEMRIGNISTAIKTLYEGIERLEKYCREETKSPVINQESLNCIEKNLERINNNEELSEDAKKTLSSGLLENQRWMVELKNAAVETKIAGYNTDDFHMPFDFLFVPASKFSSNFQKSAIGKIPVFFPSLDKSYGIGEISTVLKAAPSMNNKFFYVFYKEPVDQEGNVCKYSKNDYIQNIVKALCKCAVI